MIIGFSPNSVFPFLKRDILYRSSNGHQESPRLSQIEKYHIDTLRLRNVLQLVSDSRSNEYTEFFIRPSLSADVGRASQILADGFFKYKTNFLVYHWERLETYLSMESTFPKPNTLHQIFVACDCQSGRVLGMAEVDARVPMKSVENTGPYMCNVAVDEKYQRQGIASALIKRCERQVEEWYLETEGKIFCSLYLRVRTSNKAAVGMYSKLDYISILQEKENRTGETVIVMQKQLQRPIVSKVSEIPSEMTKGRNEGVEAAPASTTISSNCEHGAGAGKSQGRLHLCILTN